MTIKVKPLVWEDRGDYVTCFPRYKSETVLGVYYIDRDKSGLFNVWSSATRGKVQVRTLEAAKAAAQADYEARILSAIEAVDSATFCDVRKWEFYPIEMPVTADGKGPATVGEDAVRIEYEVWDRTYTSYASHDNLPDAINEAMFLNGFVDPATTKHSDLVKWIINNLLNESQLSVVAPGYTKPLRDLPTLIDKEKDHG